MSRNKIIGAVDIGTSKILVLVGETTGRGGLNIIGKGEAPSKGISKGEIIDFQAASDSVHAALLQAEDNAKTELKDVYLSLSGRHIDGFYNDGTVNVMSPDNIVSQEDVYRAIAEAKSKQIDETRLFIHNIRNPMRLDNEHIHNPVGMEGSKLQAGYWFVTANRSKVSCNMGTVTSMSCHIDDIIVSSVASAVMIATEEDKRNGIIAIDIGSGTTDYVAYRGGYIICAGVIPVGGDHITNDLSLGLRISRKHAEDLKISCAKAIVDRSDAEDEVWSIGDQAIGDRRVPRKSIYKIVNARVEEIFELVLKRVTDRCNVQDLGSGVVLTGGTSLLPKIDEACKNVFGLESRCGEHPSWVGENINHPACSTVLGLFHYALTAQDREEKPKAKGRGILSKLLNLKT